MSSETPTPKPQESARKVIYRNAGDAVYGLGVVGALFYYIPHAATFVAGILGVLKALVWPAIMVFKLLEFLKM
jgi:hypothetical protein